MGKANFIDDFKRNAVHQNTEREYPVAEVLQRLGVSAHSLYASRRKYSEPAGSGDDVQAAKIRQLRQVLAQSVFTVRGLLEVEFDSDKGIAVSFIGTDDAVRIVQLPTPEAHVLSDMLVINLSPKQDLLAFLVSLLTGVEGKSGFRSVESLLLSPVHRSPAFPRLRSLFASIF